MGHFLLADHLCITKSLHKPSELPSLLLTGPGGYGEEGKMRGNKGIILLA